MAHERELIEAVGATTVECMLDLTETAAKLPEGFSAVCMTRSFSLKSEAGELSGQWYIRVQRNPFEGEEE